MKTVKDTLIEKIVANYDIKNDKNQETLLRSMSLQQLTFILNNHMKTITLIIHPDDFNNAKKHLQTFEFTTISNFIFRMQCEKAEVTSAVNAIEYVLAGIDYIIKVN